MTREEFDDLLDKSIARQRAGHARATMPNPDFADLSTQDVFEAIPDFIRAHAGGKPVRRIHPVADFALRERWSLDDLKTRAAMSSGDFGAAMEAGLTQLMVTRYDGLAADLPKFCREMPVSNFRPVGLASLDIKEPVEIPDDLPLPALEAKVTQAGADGILKQFAGKLSFSRPVMSTYGEQIASGILAFASVFWSIEQRLVADLLSTGTVGAASGTLNVAGLGAGAYALRTGENSAGQPTGLPVHSIMTSAADEITARVLLSAIGWPAVGLTVNPYLDSLADGGSFYLFANPELHAGLLRLTLRGQPEPRIYSDTREVQVTRYAISFDVNYALSASAGSAIVKVTPP